MRLSWRLVHRNPRALVFSGARGVSQLAPLRRGLFLLGILSRCAYVRDMTKRTARRAWRIARTAGESIILGVGVLALIYWAFYGGCVAC